jgi:hypothetical protein
MDKNQLIATIKEWVRIDAEIVALRRNAKIAADQKKELTKTLVVLMKENSLDEIDLSDSKIVRKTKVSKSAVNKKHLINCLSKYYKNDDTAKEVSDLILNARTAKMVDCIVCKKEK